MERITINGIEYVKEADVKSLISAPKFNDMEYCIIRTYSAGVFAGYVESRNGKEAVLRKVRRLWYWDGACSLSELAKNGTCKPGNCKFAVEIDKITLTEVIELIPCTETAYKSITEVAEWTANK